MSDSECQETILFAVMGLSPAILTETVWALAHEEIPVIPDRVVVVTTRAGRERIEAELFTSTENSGVTVWDSLREALANRGHEVEGRLAFGMAADSIRLCSGTVPDTGMTYDLADIRNERENEAMANFILEALRGLVETTGTEVITSIAGGRKTMGALVYAAMTLVGREFDHVTHVLVSEPYERPTLKPRFYFPQQLEQTLMDTSGARFEASDAVIELAYVPFVPLRNAFASEMGHLPESFSQLVRKYRREVRGTTIRFHVVIHTSAPLLEINGERYRLAAREHVLIHFLGRQLQTGAAPLDRYGSAHEGLLKVSEALFQSRPAGNLDDWRHEARFPSNFLAEDIRKLVNQVRTRLRGHGPVPRAFADLLPKKGRFGLDLEVGRISFAE